MVNPNPNSMRKRTVGAKWRTDTGEKEENNRPNKQTCTDQQSNQEVAALAENNDIPAHVVPDAAAQNSAAQDLFSEMTQATTRVSVLHPPEKSIVDAVVRQ